MTLDREKIKARATELVATWRSGSPVYFAEQGIIHGIVEAICEAMEGDGESANRDRGASDQFPRSDEQRVRLHLEESVAAAENALGVSRTEPPGATMTIQGSVDGETWVELDGFPTRETCCYRYVRSRTGNGCWSQGILRGTQVVLSERTFNGGEDHERLVLIYLSEGVTLQPQEIRDGEWMDVRGKRDVYLSQEAIANFVAAVGQSSGAKP